MKTNYKESDLWRFTFNALERLNKKKWNLNYIIRNLRVYGKLTFEEIEELTNAIIKLSSDLDKDVSLNTILKIGKKHDWPEGGKLD